MNLETLQIEAEKKKQAQGVGYEIERIGSIEDTGMKTGVLWEEAEDEIYEEYYNWRYR